MVCDIGCHNDLRTRAVVLKAVPSPRRVPPQPGPRPAERLRVGLSLRPLPLLERSVRGPAQSGRSTVLTGSTRDGGGPAAPGPRRAPSPDTVAPVEQTFGSTTSAWKWAKIKRRPEGTHAGRAKRGRWHHLARWPRTQPLSLKVTYRGGAESWWLVETRGAHGVFPGHAAIEDVMAQVFNEPG